MTASQELQRLRDLGMVEQRGKGRATFYVLGAAAQKGVDRGGDRGTETGELGGGGDAKTGELRPQTGELHPRSDTEGASGLRSSRMDTTRGDSRSLPQALADRIAGLGGRPPKEKLQRLLEDLCGLRPWTAGELATLLGRSKIRHLVDEHLTPMVVAGRLERTDPDKPTHPNQGYRVPLGRRA